VIARRLGAVAMCVCVASGLTALAAQRPDTPAQATADFAERVRAYASLQNDLDGTITPRRTTADVGRIEDTSTTWRWSSPVPAQVPSG